MRKITFAAALLATMASGSLIAGVVGTKHDITKNGNFNPTGNTQVCVFCHTPHKAQGTGGPIWNRNYTAGAFNTYGTTQAGTLANTTVGAQSLSCLSCHDGTVAVDSIYNAPGESWTPTGGKILPASYAYVGTNLADDHPISIEYDDTVNSLKTQSGIEALTPTFNDQVECATCHSVHDNTNAPFLRVSAANSLICTHCHDR